MTTPPPDDDPATTGLPGLRTWPRVYLLVSLTFVAWVVILVAIQRTFR